MEPILPLGWFRSLRERDDHRAGERANERNRRPPREGSMPRLSVPGEPPHPASKVSDYHRYALTDRLTAPQLPALAAVAAGVAALAFAQGGYSSNTVAIATLAGWALAMLGIVLARGRGVPARDAFLAGACLAGFAGLSALSMTWADDAGRAFAASVRASGYLGLFIGVVAWAPRLRARTWLAGMAVGVGIVGVAALASRFVPALVGGSGNASYSGIPGAQGRLSYPIGYWNGLASLLALGTVLSLWWSVHGRGPAARALAVAVIPGYFLALYLTSSRGGIGEALLGVALLAWLDRCRARILATAVIASLAGLVLVAIAYGQHDLLKGLDTSSARQQGALLAAGSIVAALLACRLQYWLVPRFEKTWTGTPWRPWIVALAGTAGLAVLLVAFANLGEPGTTASPGQRDLLSSAGSGRYEFWRSALGAFASNPVKGVGAGNWELYWNVQPKLPTVVRNAHSLYLESLAELGVAGLALLAAFLATAVRAGWRRVAASEPETSALVALVVAGALAAGVDWTFQLPAVFAPLVVAAALLVSGARTEALGRALPRAALALGLAIAGWAATWAAATTLLANAHLASSRQAAASGDLVTSAREARAAADVEPFSSGPLLQLALAEQAGGNLDAARADAGAAIRLAGADWQGWYVISRIDSQAGRAHEAKVERTVADALAPVALPGG